MKIIISGGSNFIFGEQYPNDIDEKYITENYDQLFNSGDANNSSNLEIKSSPVGKINFKKIDALDIKTDSGSNIDDLNIKIFNLNTLVEYLSDKEKKGEINDFYYTNMIDIIKIYETTLGGCGCNKNSRIINADNYFKNRMLSTEKSFFNNLKINLNVKEIVFEDYQKNIFLKI